MANKSISIITALFLTGVIVFLGSRFSTVQNDVNKGAAYIAKVAGGHLPLAKTRVVSPKPSPVPQDFVTLWYTDFGGKRVGALDRAGNKVWTQRMDAPPLPPSGYATHTEYVTVAPNGNLIVSDGEGMFVQEIDRKTHGLVWQYGHKDIQSAADGYLHQPDKTFKINDHEVLINDGNNRRVIIVDQNTNKIVWQYGETLRMGTKPGMLMAATNTVPLDGGRQILITDTLQKKVIIVDRATKNIVWEWTKPDASWLQHVFPTSSGTFLMEDRNKKEVFEVDRSGKILWLLNKIGGRAIAHPTDIAKLGNGNILVAESDRRQITEVNPVSGEIVREYKNLGEVTTIALDQNSP